ncbi:MAG: amidohydrolase family protein [Chloroflexi bacterium]|nr:amidohydrolase family protein [Chloroflexota bacterium]
MWKHLAGGGLSSVGTDHCPFFYETQKILGRDDFTKMPNGLPGIESRLSLLHTFGVALGRLSLNRWVEVCCAAPAQIFGLYPKKGSLTPGADADIVIFDPAKEVTLSTQVLHEHVDYTPYDGFQLRGWPVMTIVRGKVMVEEGRFVGPRGQGKFLVRN